VNGKIKIREVFTMKRTFSKEFKIKACELVLKDEIKHAVVAEKMGINKIMLYRWIDEYETYGEEAFVGKGRQRSSDAELRKLRKENERLKMEMEILKKAAAYFAKHPADE
jgi:transposase-like protein